MLDQPGEMLNDLGAMLNHLRELLNDLRELLNGLRELLNDPRSSGPDMLNDPADPPEGDLECGDDQSPLLLPPLRRGGLPHRHLDLSVRRRRMS